MRTENMISRARPRLQEPEHTERLVECVGRHIEPRMEPAEAAERVERVEGVFGDYMGQIVCRQMMQDVST